MAARRIMLPDYGTVSMKGTQYYRTRVTDQQGRRLSLYARMREKHTIITDYKEEAGIIVL